MQSETDMAALLRLYLDAGVTETIGEEPIDRYQLAKHPPIATAPLTSKLADAPAATRNSKVPVAPVPSFLEDVRAAKDLANSCATIDELRKALEGFEHCALKKLATHTVFAEGNSAAKLLILDRQPSSDEDRSGMPFSGAAGQLLDKMLSAIGIDRKDVYLASAIPWRPPGGRTPTDEERALCLPFAMRHIELAKPSYILACGEAGGYLLDKKVGINKLRGRWNDLQIGDVHARMLPIFHPAFLLDQPGSKKLAWADLLNLKAELEQER